MDELRVDSGLRLSRERLAQRRAIGDMSQAGRLPQAARGQPEALAQALGCDIPLYRKPEAQAAGAADWPGDWICVPRSPREVAGIANWAAQSAVRLDALEAPKLSSRRAASARASVLAVDLTQHLNRMELISCHGRPAVRAQTGVSLEELLQFAEQGKLGLSATPADGELTLARALASNAHGSGLLAEGVGGIAGQTCGSISNRVMELTAVVFSRSEGRYRLRRFERSQRSCAALLTHLGRALLTEVVLALEPDRNLRCISMVDVPASELFAAPDSGGRNFAGLVQRSGGVDVSWQPFTRKPWTRIRTPVHRQPPSARAVTAPCNHPFRDAWPDQLNQLAAELVSGQPDKAPDFSRLMHATLVAGLKAANAGELWGASKNILLHGRPWRQPTLSCGYAVLTRRNQVQRVVHEHAGAFQRLLQDYRARGEYPINMPLEYQVTGLDRGSDLGIAGAQDPTLSSLRPRADKPHWDTAVWLRVQTLAGTPGQQDFFRDLEDWMHLNFNGDYAGVRPEWSGWVTGGLAADSLIPDLFRAGDGRRGWDEALATLHYLDPAGVFDIGPLAGLPHRRAP